MAHTAHSEAACLLETGKLYTSRVGLKPPGGGELTFAGCKKGAFSLYFGDLPIYHFDFEGRWQRIFLEGSHFLKGLDTTVHRIDRVREGANLVLKRTILSFAEATDLDARVRAMALDLIDSVAGSKLARQEPPAEVTPLSNSELIDLLERVAAWDADAWFAHRERYLGTYGPLPFLPPDCQNPVVLQATLGHAGVIGFGGSAAAEHYVRSPSEFEAHCRDVAKILGRRIAQCHTVFLAGADVIRQPIESVNSYLDTIGKTFPISDALDGIHVFLDDLADLHLDANSWRGFRDRGLKRVSLGIESGEAGIRTRFGKSWNEEELRLTARGIKDAGIAVSILTLVGAGGAESEKAHEVETARLIKSLGLGSGDFVFLLDPNELRDAESRDSVPSLTGEAWSAQQARLKAALKPEEKGLWKVLPYSLEKQWA